MTTVECEQCHDIFSYAPPRVRRKRGGYRKVRIRQYCDTCARNQRKATFKRADDGRSGALVGDGKRILRGKGGWTHNMSREALARRMGTTTKMIMKIEASALDKLRRSPKARQVLLELREAGPDAAQALLTPPDHAELVDYQLSVGEWWAKADELAAAGHEEAAKECLAEIEKFQQVLRNAVMELRAVDPGTE